MKCACDGKITCMWHFDIDAYILGDVLKVTEEVVPDETTQEGYDTWVGEQYLIQERNDL